MGAVRRKLKTGFVEAGGGCGQSLRRQACRKKRGTVRFGSYVPDSNHGTPTIPHAWLFLSAFSRLIEPILPSQSLRSNHKGK